MVSQSLSTILERTKKPSPRCKLGWVPVPVVVCHPAWPRRDAGQHVPEAYPEQPIRGQYPSHVICPDQSEASILTWRAERGRRRGWGWCRSYCRPGCATRSAVLFYFIFWLFYFMGFFYVDIKVFWGLLQELWKRGYRGPGIIWIEIWIKDQVTNFFHCGPINIFILSWKEFLESRYLLLLGARLSA